MTNAILIANGVNVEGNIQAEGARRVQVNGYLVVDGSIQLKQGCDAHIANVTVGSDV